MFDSTLDITSLVSRITKLEEEQNLRNKNILWLKRYYDDLRQEFDTRPEPQQIKGLQIHIAQLSLQVADLQQRINQLPVSNRYLDDAETSNGLMLVETIVSESVNFADQLNISPEIEHIDQEHYQESPTLTLTASNESVVDTDIPVNADVIEAAVQPDHSDRVFTDLEFKTERMIWLLNRIYAAEEGSYEPPMSSEEFLKIGNCGGSDLRGANLENANLKDANLTEANLDNAKLSGATIPDGTIHK